MLPEGGSVLDRTFISSMAILNRRPILSYVPEAKDEKAAVYALVDPRTNQVGYIGVTVMPKERLSGHIHNLDHTKKSRWIANILRMCFEPEMYILEWISPTKAGEAEKSWLEIARKQGWRLTNTGLGGSGYSSQRYALKKKQATMKLRETERDAEIIEAILREHPHLRGNRSGAVRVALEAWAADRKMCDAWAAAQAARHQGAAAAQEPGACREEIEK